MTQEKQLIIYSDKKNISLIFFHPVQNRWQYFHTPPESTVVQHQGSAYRRQILELLTTVGKSLAGVINESLAKNDDIDFRIANSGPEKNGSDAFKIELSRINQAVNSLFSSTRSKEEGEEILKKITRQVREYLHLEELGVESDVTIRNLLACLENKNPEPFVVTSQVARDFLSVLPCARHWDLGGALSLPGFRRPASPESCLKRTRTYCPFGGAEETRLFSGDLDFTSGFLHQLCFQNIDENPVLGEIALGTKVTQHLFVQLSEPTKPRDEEELENIAYKFEDEDLARAKSHWKPKLYKNEMYYKFSGSFFEFPRVLHQARTDGTNQTSLEEACFYAFYGQTIDAIQVALSGVNDSDQSRAVDELSRAKVAQPSELYTLTIPVRVCGYDHFINLPLKIETPVDFMAEEQDENICHLLKHMRFSARTKTIFQESVRELLVQVHIAAFQSYVDADLRKRTFFGEMELMELFSEHAPHIVRTSRIWLARNDKVVWVYSYPDELLGKWRKLTDDERCIRNSSGSEKGRDSCERCPSIEDGSLQTEKHIAQVFGGGHSEFAMYAHIPWESNFSKLGLNDLFQGTSAQRLSEQWTWLTRRYNNRVAVLKSSGELDYAARKLEDAVRYI